MTAQGEHVYCVSVTCGGTCLSAGGGGRALERALRLEHEDHLFRDLGDFPQCFFLKVTGFESQLCDWATTSSVRSGTSDGSYTEVPS